MSQSGGVEHGSGAVGQRRRHDVTLAARVMKARQAKSPDRCGKAIEKPNARFCRDRSIQVGGGAVASVLID
jgi:hypothetical protein